MARVYTSFPTIGTTRPIRVDHAIAEHDIDILKTANLGYGGDLRNNGTLKNRAGRSYNDGSGHQNARRIWQDEEAFNRLQRSHKGPSCNCKN